MVLCSAIDENAAGTTNIHLNGLILFDNAAGSCTGIAHRDLQGTRIVIGGTGEDKGPSVDDFPRPATP